MIETRNADSIPPGANPFHHDQFNMGTKIASNVTIMHPSFPEQETEYVIVVNTKTGERLRVYFSPAGYGPSIHEEMMARMVREGKI